MNAISWHYFYVFLQSSLLELPFYYLLLRKFAPGLVTRSLHESERFLFFLCAVVAINSVTHPVLFFGILNLKQSYIQNILAAQGFAIVSETILLKHLVEVGVGRALFAALTANTASWQLAPILTYLIFRN